VITFENSPVKIGDFYVIANSASISISNPRRGTKSFGEPGLDSQVREGAAVGTVNVSYYMTTGDADVRNLFTGNGIQLFDISVGPYRCYSGVANSMSMAIEPYSVISCTLDMSFYNGYDQLGATSNIDAPSASGIMDGGASEASTDLLWGTDVASVNYSMAQSISPVYSLGELMPGGYTRDGGTIQVGIDGTGWGHIVDTTTICEGYTTGNISIDTLCGCTTSVQHAEGEWEIFSRVDSVVKVSGSAFPCPSCWEIGDLVAITWPASAPAPWPLGVSAEIYDISLRDGGCDIGYKWGYHSFLPDPPEAYKITVSNARAPTYTIPFSGHVIDPEVTVAPNGELKGSLTVLSNLLEP